MPSWMGSEQKTHTGRAETPPPAVVRPRRLLAQLFAQRHPAAEDAAPGLPAEEKRDDA